MARLGRCFFPLLHQAGNHLHGFAQAHVVGQTAVQAQIF
jgi:hypothetical protein